MNKDRLKEKLTDLLEILDKEREYAKKLDIDNFETTLEEKKILLVEIGEVSSDDPEIQELALKVRNANLRCAYLYHKAKVAVQTSMNFFGEQSPTPTYGAQGKIHSEKGGGLLFSSEA